ncbi:hypothetical protein CRG98_026437 [Punica granatum]|uniref:SCP domain-containing protein n=1 Tax=Punica granatum TaxID=22663 RepID=A0A2I0JBY8_PUNGR|nr:hypothetical protein CRG98_026437 [Punica granatum]
MGIRKITLLLIIFLMTLTLTRPSLGQDSPQDFVNAHNAARAQVGVGPISWNETIAAYAHDYASKRAGDCRLVHSGKVCGHYTQVVWRNSVRLGCAKIRCITGGTFIGCNYDPPGNFIGQQPYPSLSALTYYFRSMHMMLIGCLICLLY